MASSPYTQDADGTKFIPATQRPDGTWRKPRRIKDGYVPQEEVPLYESKGKLFRAKQQTGIPVGLTPEIVAAAQKPKKQQNNTVQPIPGLVLNADKGKKKKKKKSSTEEVADKLGKCEISEPTFNDTPTDASPTPSKSTDLGVSNQDPTKKLKNLRKKLRDIEILEEKIKAGILKTPDKDQKEKLTKKSQVISEINNLEKELGV